MNLAMISALLAAQAFAQAVITDSGSTNRRGMTVTVDANGDATVESRGTKIKMKMEPELQNRFMKDLEAAGPLDQIKARHCMKSASFGSTMSVTYKGVQSPDLSCGGQSDPVAITLQKDMQEIMQQAHSKVPSMRPMM